MSVRLFRAAGAVLLLAAAAQVRGAEPPPVLAQLPSDAGAVLVVPNVRTLSTKTSNLGVRLGLQLPPDIVGFLLRNVGVAKGFDQNGSAAAVYLKPRENAAPDDEPPTLVLVPTNDAPGLLSTFSPGAADATGIMEITLAQDTAEKAYAVVVAEKWIAVSEQKETLSRYLKRTSALDKAMAPELLKLFDTSDAVVWVNAAGVGPTLLKQLENLEEDTTGRLDLTNMTNDRDPVSSAFEKEGLLVGFSGLKAALGDAQTGAISLRLSDNGATVGFTGVFTPGTETARLVGAQKGLAAPGFQGLPGGNFLVAGSKAWNGASAGELFQKAIDQVFADQVLAQDAKAAGVRKVLDHYRQIFSLSAGARFVLLDTPAGPRGGLLNGALLLDTADPEKVNALHIQAYQEAGGNAGPGLGGEIQTNVVTSVDAVTIKGIKLSRIQISYKLRDEPGKPPSDEAKASLALINRLVGAEGLTFYTGVAGKQVLTVFGADAATLEAAVAASQETGEPLAQAAPITTAKGEVLANAQGVVYINTPRVLAVLQNLLNPAPENGRGQGPGGPGRGRGRGGRGGGGPGVSPAMAVSVTTSGNAAQVQVFLPLPALRFGMQFVGGGENE
jgi:hypothetical protein